jgi:hypothetical protein
MPPSARPPAAEWHVARERAGPSASATAKTVAHAKPTRANAPLPRSKVGAVFASLGALPPGGDPTHLPGFPSADPRQQRRWCGLAMAVTLGKAAGPGTGSVPVFRIRR